MVWSGWNICAKHDGQGVMISAFQSRELGFGMVLTKGQLDEVNFLRRGKKYIDKEAAKKVQRTWTRNWPFVQSICFIIWLRGIKWRLLELWLDGVAAWRLHRCFEMSLSTLWVSFPIRHSCGHNKQQPNGAENMLKNYRGQQSILRSTVIKQEKGYLGPHTCTLNPGDVQHFIFSETTMMVRSGSRKE